MVAGLWTAALVTYIAPLPTKSDWIYYRYNVHQKICGLHWEYLNRVIQGGLVQSNSSISSRSCSRSS